MIRWSALTKKVYSIQEGYHEIAEIDPVTFTVTPIIELTGSPYTAFGISPDGHFLLQVLSSIEPRAIDWDIVKKGEADEDKENNAKYVVSIVRKLGGVVFCVWEDLVKVDYKQTFILFATIYELDQQIKAGAGSA